MTEPRTIAQVLIVAVIGLHLALIGGICMLLGNLSRRKRMARLPEEGKKGPEWFATASIVHPWREQFLGILVTLAVPVFAHFCVVGRAGDTVAIAVGYMAAALCSLGCFYRQRRELDELETGDAAKGIRQALILFAAGLALFLWGVLSLALAIYLFFTST